MQPASAATPLTAAESSPEIREKLGWKLQRKNEDDEVERFCRGVGVSRQVFKVWMHNHKNSSSSASIGNASSLSTTDQ
ncbi:hypothetical protein QYF36_007875 [Acer negundo]|nr:hypothetical protein QYF36_007875 [Acer negundo]